MEMMMIWKIDKEFCVCDDEKSIAYQQQRKQGTFLQCSTWKIDLSRSWRQMSWRKKSWRNFWVRIAVDDDDDDEDVHVCMEACFSDRNEWNLHINGFGLIKFWALYLLIDLKSSSLFLWLILITFLITRITQIEYWWVAQPINTTDRKLRKSWTFIQLFPTLLFNCAVLNTSTMNKF